MQLPSLAQIRAACLLVYQHMPPTPQYTWPLLNRRLGIEAPIEAWIKHENHTPVGAFKIRGALVYLKWLQQTQPKLTGVIAATRGNFGQGVAMAARLFGLQSTVVVPFGNSSEKNRAMRAQGAELVEHGHDFQESLEFARAMAAERGRAFVESFHERLVTGTATYALELFEGVPPREAAGDAVGNAVLDAIYVPIGLGSSICGVIAARNALGLATEIVGVVAAESPSYALSFNARRLIEAPSRTALADGLACRRPDAEALETIFDHAARIIEVSDAEIAEAMRAYYEDTHNLAEGAGAAALAGALKEKAAIGRKRIGIVLSGGNVDRDVYAAILGGAPNRKLIRDSGREPDRELHPASPARTA